MSLVSAVIQEVNKTNTEDITKAPNDLLPKIIDFTERLQVFSWGLQNYYIDVYLTSDSSRSLEQMNYKNRKYRAFTDLDELQEDIQAFRKDFGENDEDINNACLKLDVIVKSFNDACTVVDGTYILQTAARDLKSLKYVDAIVNLKDLHKRLDKIDFQGNLALALRSFRAISETQLAVSQGLLSVEWSNIFRWNFNKGVHTLTYSLSVQHKDPILLESVLKALYVADQMIVDIEPFSEFFISVLLPNIIKHNCEIFIEDHVGALVFNIKIDLNDNDRPSIPTIFNNLMAVFEFLETTMGSKLEAGKTFLECFGACNREEFFNKIIQDCIRNNLPYSENSFRAYKEIALELETFNKFLVDQKYVEEDKSPLKKYVGQTDLLLYDTKCNKMLAEVRELLKECLARTTVTVGYELETPEHSTLDVTHKEFNYDFKTPIFFPKCVVSQNVRKIATIISTYLKESAAYPQEYANQLVLYVKDIAVMYEEITAQRNAVRLKTHAFEIALFFNNCHYLAHSLIGPPWKNVLPKAIADQINTILMSYIYDLRVAGMEKLSIFLKHNREVICHKITSSDNTICQWDQLAFEKFNRDINYALGLLMEMKEAWFEILPERMYERAMCSLVEALGDVMIKQVLRNTGDIAEVVVHLLASRFLYTIDEIKELFPEPAILQTKIKQWERFTLIPKLFTAQLLEIATMWNATNALKGKFTCEEVRAIIKMRFPNTNYRLKILKDIQ